MDFLDLFDEQIVLASWFLEIPFVPQQKPVEHKPRP